MGEGDKPVQVGTTAVLAGLLDRRELDRVYLLAHPNRWARTYPELVVEWTKDLAVNVAKRGINLVP